MVFDDLDFEPGFGFGGHGLLGHSRGKVQVSLAPGASRRGESETLPFRTDALWAMILRPMPRPSVGVDSWGGSPLPLSLTMRRAER